MDLGGVPGQRNGTREDGDRNCKDDVVVARKDSSQNLVSSLPTTNPIPSPSPMDLGGVPGQTSGAREDGNRDQDRGRKDEMDGALEHYSPDLVSRLPTPSPTHSPSPLDRRGVKRLRDDVEEDGDLGRADKKEEGPSDLISSLPLDLGVAIFSHFDILDGVTARMVCRYWHQVWRATPVNLIDGDIDLNARDSAIRQQVINYILKEHPGPVRSFLCCYVELTPTVIANFKLWFSNPKFDTLDELTLTFSETTAVRRRLLPQAALSFTSVRVMAIANCHIQAGSEIRSSRLADLEMYGVAVHSDTLQRMLSRCPALAKLKLVRIIGLQTLCLKLKKLCKLYVKSRKKGLVRLSIEFAPSLEEIYLDHFSGPSVVIDSAPMLQTLGYMGLETPSLQIGHLRLKQSSAVKIVGHCTIVTKLAIKMLCPDLNYIADFLNLFPHLQRLHISFVGQSLNDISERREGPICSSDREGPINCLQHTLRDVCFWNYPEWEHNLEFTNYFIERSCVLENLVFATQQSHGQNWTWNWARMNTRHLASPHIRFYFASFEYAKSVGSLPMIMEDDPFVQPVSVYEIMTFPRDDDDGDDDDDDDDDDAVDNDEGSGGDGHNQEGAPNYGNLRQKETHDRDRHAASRENNSNNSSSKGNGEQSGRKTYARLGLHNASILILQDMSNVACFVLEKDSTFARVMRKKAHEGKCNLSVLPCAAVSAILSTESSAFGNAGGGGGGSWMGVFFTKDCFLHRATLIAPSISTYLPQAWRGAMTNPDASRLDCDRISAFNKVSSSGLIGALMGLAEACSVAVQSILTVGGVGGVATAFAARDVLGNILIGFLQFSKPFSVNDYIKVGPKEGRVDEIGLTSTSLISPGKLPVIVPNSLFSSQRKDDCLLLSKKFFREPLGLSSHMALNWEALCMLLGI